MFESIPDILEVCLYVSDIAEAERFYKDLFAMEPYSRSGSRHVFFRVGKMMFLLFNPDETRKQGSVPSHGATGEGHIAFAITHEKISFWRRRLQAHNVAIEQEYEWPAGGHSIYFRDPFGNSIELATRDTWPVL